MFCLCLDDESYPLSWGILKHLFAGRMTCHVRIQLQDLKKLPSAFAFAFVEHRQIRETAGSDNHGFLVVLRLRMYLAGEVKQMNIDKVESSLRLINMLTLISKVPNSVYILKVTCSRKKT